MKALSLYLSNVTALSLGAMLHASFLSCRSYVTQATLYLNSRLRTWRYRIRDSVSSHLMPTRFRVGSCSYTHQHVRLCEKWGWELGFQ